MNKILTILVLCIAPVLAACGDLSPKLPAGSQDESEFTTSHGAMAMYRGSMGFAQEAFKSFVSVTGLFTDEFIDKRFDNPNQTGVQPTGADSRQIDPVSSQIRSLYHALHGVRSNATLTAYSLKTYAQELPSSYQSHMYLLHGYAVIMMADFFCSGVPLSKIDPDADFTYLPGSSRDEMYMQAIALLDTAVLLAGDSTYLKHAAHIGQGRALIQLNRFEDAVQKVVNVPDSARYRLQLTLTAGFLGSSVVFDGNVADLEGKNGLPYRSSNDPRSRSQLVAGVQTPLKYLVNAGNQIAWLEITNGIEARLIEAEADLKKSGTLWLGILNDLRSGGFTVSQSGDTTWLPGTGGFTELRPLNDPADTISDPVDAARARIKLLFDERAYWMYLTGHRQGDLRRMVRQYGYDSEEVYPTGFFGNSGLAMYGSDVTAPVPETEYMYNKLYEGCINRDA